MTELEHGRAQVALDAEQRLRAQRTMIRPGSCSGKPLHTDMLLTGLGKRQDRNWNIFLTKIRFACYSRHQMLIGADQAKERIKPIESILVEAHKSATSTWSALVREHPRFALPLDATARANFVHCHLRSEIDQRIAGRNDVTVNDRLGFYALWLHPDVLLRIKYVGNGDGAPHNYPTRQQQLLARQWYDSDMLDLLGIDGSFAAPTFLTCGHTLDELDLGRIEIRFDCVGHLPWTFSIYGDDAAAVPLIFEGMADDTKPAKVTSSRKTQRKDDGQADRG